jgi:hypothetical protein
VFVTIPVLEEALRVESVSSKPVSEGCKDTLDNLSLVISCIATSIEGLSTDIIKASVNLLLEVLLCEYLINAVTKVLPANVSAFLGGAEGLK